MSAAGLLDTSVFIASETGRKMNGNDLWIAAIAAANDLPVITQDADFVAIEDLGGPAVVRV